MNQPSIPQNRMKTAEIQQLFKDRAFILSENGQVNVTVDGNKKLLVSNYWSVTGNVVFTMVKYPNHVLNDVNAGQDATKWQSLIANIEHGMTFRIVGKNEMRWIIDYGVEIAFERVNPL